MLLLALAGFFQNKHLQKILSGTFSECQTVWRQIRTDFLSVLVWVQTVCKDYQHVTKMFPLAWKVLKKSCFDTVDLDDRLQNVASHQGLHCFVIIRSEFQGETPPFFSPENATCSLFLLLIF